MTDKDTQDMEARRTDAAGTTSARDTTDTTDTNAMDVTDATLERAIEARLDELERESPSKDDGFPPEERRYVLEMMVGMRGTMEEKMATIRKTNLLEMFLVSMF